MVYLFLSVNINSEQVDFFKLIWYIQYKLPSTSLHVLSVSWSKPKQKYTINITEELHIAKSFEFLQSDIRLHFPRLLHWNGNFFPKCSTHRKLHRLHVPAGLTCSQRHYRKWTNYLWNLWNMDQAVNITIRLYCKEILRKETSLLSIFCITSIFCAIICVCVCLICLTSEIAIFYIIKNVSFSTHSSTYKYKTGCYTI